MFEISVDAIECIERVSEMMINIRDFGHVDIHDELLDWQVEDMHRHYPNIDSDQEYISWFTLIWPRSRTYDQRHQGAKPLRRASMRATTRPRVSSTPRLVGGGSSRPILRPALVNRLEQRMGDLLGERLSWARTGDGFGGSRSEAVGGD